MGKHVTIKKKLLIGVIPVYLAALAAIIFFIWVYTTDKLTKSAQNEAGIISRQYANMLKGRFDSHFEAIRTLALVLSNYRDMPAMDRRNDIDKMYEDFIAGHPEFNSVITIWEPNVLDGRDRLFTSGSGESRISGRFIREYKAGPDGVTVRTLPDADTTRLAYGLLRDTKCEQILNPPLHNEDTPQKEVAGTTIIVPIIDDGRFIGVTGIELNLSMLLPVIKSIKPYGTGHALFVANNGVRVAQTKTNLLGKILWEQPYFSPEMADYIKNCIRTGQEFHVEKISLTTGKNSYQHYSPVFFGHTTTPWSFGVVIPFDIITSEAEIVTVSLAGLGLMAMLIGILMIIRLSNRITKPIEKLTELSQRIATGETGVTANVETNDEVGVLSQSFNVMTAQLQSVMEDLRLSNEKYRMAQHSSKFCGWEMDPQSGKLDWFPEIDAMFEMPVIEPIDNYEIFLRRVHPADHDRVSNDICTAVKHKSYYYSEYRVRLSDGSYKWVMDAGDFYNGSDDGRLRFIGIVQDISKLKIAEIELKKLASVVEQSTSIIIITDNELVIDYTNKAYTDFTGYRKNLAKSKPVRIYENESIQKRIRIELQKVLNGKSCRFEFSTLRNNGAPVWFDALLFPLYDNDGNVKGVVHLLNDISERKKIEERIRQSQKMEAIGLLAGGIAHDFNNLLTAIISSAEIGMLIDKENILEAQLKKILKASDRAKNLTRQILTFSRMKEQEKSPVDLNTIIKEVVNLLRETIGPSITLQFTPKPEPQMIFADSTQIHQVLMNLCTNSIQALKVKGSRIEITSEIISLTDSQSRTHNLQAGTYVRLVVCDDGPGISPDIRHKIFDPFFTTRGVGEGTGLGLSVVHGIIASHDGDISLYTEEGVGTSFHIYFPYHGKEEAAPEEQHAEPGGGHERILLVDDEVIIAENNKEILSIAGYEVLCFSSSKAAMELIRNFPESFDCALLDQVMPEFSGIDLAREIQKSGRKVPIIICSGFSEQISTENYQDFPVQAFLMKPVHRRDLLETVRKVLSTARED